jgi:hypothetical protein
MILIHRQRNLSCMYQQLTLMVQRPGFGKARLTLELLSNDTLSIFLTPATALRDQVFPPILLRAVG